MKMFALGLAMILTLAGVAPTAPTPKTEPADPKDKNLSSAELIRKALDAKVNFEFNGLNLSAVLAQLSEDHRINFVLDKAVIQQMGFEPNDLMVEIKLKDVKLRNGLRTMLGQYNLTFAIVGDTVIVTTEEQAIYKQLKHRISVDFDNVPLNKAIKELAMANGVNVVVDPRTMKNKGAETPVTINVDDVPFEAVVRLMCEMAGLKPARMGNVIFITTEDRADKLKDSDSLVPNPGLPGGPMFPGVPGLPGGLGGPGGLIPPAIGGIAPAVPMIAPMVKDEKVPAEKDKN